MPSGMGNTRATNDEPTDHADGYHNQDQQDHLVLKVHEDAIVPHHPGGRLGHISC